MKVVERAAMLRSFRVANHKSIYAEQELSLLPAYDKSRPTVPVAAVFGANASGKSNLIDALSWLQRAVDQSYAAWKPDTGVPRYPFRLAPAASEEPSVFIVEFMGADIRYVYGLVADDKKIREEWLYSYPRNRKRVVFEREGSSWIFGTHVPRGEVDVLTRLTRDNTLFLSVAGQSNFPETAQAYGWLQRSLLFGSGFGRRGDLRIIDFLEGGSGPTQRLVALTRQADLGIVDVRVSAAPSADKESVFYRPELEFVHGDSGVVMRTWEQSKGTLEWLSLLVSALTALERGAVLCVDEIDSSLHSRLTPRLIELFRHDETNPLGAQLIFTTHDATLLGTSFGEDILARDEIWFVQKDSAGGTSLFSLAEFHPRKDENTERRYLGGSYGAVP
ncbi:MAG TPA: AAA family ATPase, partial [Micromonosporaceae bacterium]|nr:AAA family ATPase [Micromonosporaceae bacterium]